MDKEIEWKGTHHPTPGAWRGEKPPLLQETSSLKLTFDESLHPSPQDQSKLLELLGLINLKILGGDSLYFEVEGIVYKVLYGVYWRSVFTGVEHYLLRCNEITDGMWIEGQCPAGGVDLAIRYTEGGWIVKDSSLKFIVFRD